MSVFRRLVNLWLALSMVLAPGNGGGDLLRDVGRLMVSPLTRSAAVIVAGAVASIGPNARLLFAQTAPPPQKSWGSNHYGQLGNATYQDSHTPVSVVGLGVVTGLAGGYGHSLAVKADGTVAAWGKNLDGQLGDGTGGDKLSPVAVSGLSGMVAVAAGKNHSLGLKSDGTVWAWGSNRLGQLGRSTPTTCVDFDGVTISCSLVPLQIQDFTNVATIAAGSDFSLAVKRDGTVWAWGDNEFGQLGDATTTQRGMPVQVLGPAGSGHLLSVVGIAGGLHHTVAFKTDGTVWAWGGNVSGQLGNNSTAPSSVPVQVQSVRAVTAVAAGDYHSLALRADGSVWAWGKNNFGQLGATSSSTCNNGISFPCSLVPLRVSGVADAGGIAAGGGHSLAVRRGPGTVWAWGENDSGELGDGTTTNQPSPVLVSGLSGARRVAAGASHSLAGTTGPASEVVPPGSEHNPPLINQATAGDPIDTFTGSFTESFPDVAIGGSGPTPTFIRTYNSDDPSNSVGLGAGWTHSYAMRVIVGNSGSGSLILVGAMGRRDTYTPNSGGQTFTPPDGVYTRLRRNGSGYTATLEDQSTWQFDSTGRLTQLTDRFGVHSDLTYDAATGQLRSVSDAMVTSAPQPPFSVLRPARGSLTLDYDVGGQLTTVSDWFPRSVHYEYDQGRLIHSFDRANARTSYEYEATSDSLRQNLLTRITNANGHDATINHYINNGGGFDDRRVDTQQDGAANTTTLAYNPPDAEGDSSTSATLPPISFSDNDTRPVQLDTYDQRGLLTAEQFTRSGDAGDTVTLRTSYTEAGLPAHTELSGPSSPTLVTDFCYDTGRNLLRRFDPAISDALNGGVVVRPLSEFVYTPSPAGPDRDNLTIVRPPLAFSNASHSNGTTVSCSGTFTASPEFATTIDYDSSGMRVVHVIDGTTASPNEQITYSYTDSANPGEPTQITTQAGRSDQFTYADSGSEAGLLKTLTEAPGFPDVTNTTTYNYDSVARLRSVQDPTGQTWSSDYDAEDRPTTVSSPPPEAGQDPLQTDIRYDAVGNRTAVIDPGRVVTFIDPSTGAAQQSSGRQVTTYSYDTRELLSAAHQSARGWFADNAGNIPPNPDELLTTYTYDPLGQVERVTRWASSGDSSRVTDYAYDGLGQLRREREYPQGGAPAIPNHPTSSVVRDTTVAYDAVGSQTETHTPVGRTTIFGYDGADRLASISHPDGTVDAAYEYDAGGNRRFMDDHFGRTTYSHDQLDRLLSVSSPNPLQSGQSLNVSYTYDADGNRQTLSYPDNTTLTYGYDQANRLTTVGDSSGRAVVSYLYEPDGMLRSAATAVSGGATTTAAYAYDAARRLKSVVNSRPGPDTTISQHTYTLDGVGNRSHIDELAPQLDTPGPGGPFLAQAPSLEGQQVDLTPTNNDAALAPDDGQQAASVDQQPLFAAPGPRPGSRRDATPLPLRDQAAVPNGDHRLRADAGPYGADLFDKASNVADVRMSHRDSGTMLRFTVAGAPRSRDVQGTSAIAGFDGFTVKWRVFTNRVKEDVVLASRPATNHIDFAVEQRGLTFVPDGQGGYRARDSRGVVRFHIVSPTMHDANGRAGKATLSLTNTSATLQLDPAFLASATYPVTVDPTTFFSVDWGYDGVSELNLVSVNAGTGVSTYAYDKAGNRTTLTRSGSPTTYTYDRSDHILGDYTSDEDGNITGGPSAASDGQRDFLAYDQSGRLIHSDVHIFLPNCGADTTTTTDYQYDGDGNRALTTTTSTDAVSCTASTTSTGYVYDVNGGVTQLITEFTAGGLTRKYVRGADVAYTLDGPTGSETLTVYHKDGLGSVRALTDSNGNVLETYLTDEFGVPTDTEGSHVQSIQYAGEAREPGNGSALYDLRSRTYAAPVGRFLQKDATFGSLDTPQSLNRYTYAQNNATDLTDPNGDNPLLAACAVGAAVDIGFEVGERILAKEQITGMGILRAGATGCLSGLLLGPVGGFATRWALRAGGRFILQRLTTSTVENFAANPIVASRLLAPLERDFAQRSGRGFVLGFGKAVERDVRQKILAHPKTLGRLFDLAGGPYAPDFVGNGILRGINFDITTKRAVAAHLARPGYGRGLQIATYSRPAGFAFPSLP